MLGGGITDKDGVVTVWKYKEMLKEANYSILVRRFLLIVKV